MENPCSVFVVIDHTHSLIHSFIRMHHTKDIHRNIFDVLLCKNQYIPWWEKILILRFDVIQRFFIWQILIYGFLINTISHRIYVEMGGFKFRFLFSFFFIFHDNKQIDRFIIAVQTIIMILLKWKNCQWNFG